LLAVLAVAAMITALYVWRGESPDSTTPASATTTKTSSAPAPSATGTPTSTAKTSTTPPASSATSATTTAANPKSTAKVGDLEVVVLNQTSRKGLASAVATTLRDKGWTVALISNFRGNVTATTVYYPPGAQADAEAAAAALPTEPRVRPRFGNLSTTRLTVVVTDSYPS
jgi:cytoskeletal protein RodZ